MLYVTFRAGEDGFAVSARELERVLPYAALKALPKLHPAYAGTLDLHAVPVPVLDVNVLLGGSPVRERLDTRILLCPASEITGGRRFGLAAEGVMAELHAAEDLFVPAAATTEETRFAGPLTPWQGGFVQRIRPAAIMNPELCARLWPQG